LILNALAKEPADRVQSMDAFAALLAGPAVPTTLVLDEGSIPSGHARPGTTVSLDEPAESFPTRARHPSEPRLARTPVSGKRTPLHRTPMQAAKYLDTTMSSTSGQLGTDALGLHGPSGGRKIVVIAIVATALVAAIAVGAFKVLGPGGASTESGSTERRAEPLPAFSPPPVPLPLPPPPPPRPEARNVVHADDAEEPPAGEPEPSIEARKTRAVRERGHTRRSGQAESKLGKAAPKSGSEAAAVTPDKPLLPPPPHPTIAPTPADPTPIPKVITREKF
jgi:hypothetical protein